MNRSIVIWASLITLVGLAGCHKNAPRTVFSPAGYVRLDALEHMHPAWDDVKQLDALIAQARALPATTEQAAFALPEAPMPPSLRSAPPAPAPRMSPPAQAIGPAIARVEALQTTLRERNGRIVARQRVARQTDVEAAVSAYRAQVLTRQTDEERQIVRQQHKIWLNLEFQRISLQSMMRSLGGRPWGPDIPQRLSAVEQKIAAVNAETPRLIEQNRAKNEAAIAAYRREQEAALDEELKRREAQLNDEAAKTIASYQAAIRTSVAALRPIELTPLPNATAGKRSTLPSPAQVAAGAAVPTAQRTAQSAAAGIAQTVAERDRLAQVIAGDTRRRVAAIATRNNWPISYRPGAGVDYTERVAELLHEEWRAQPVQ